MFLMDIETDGRSILPKEIYTHAYMYLDVDNKIVRVRLIFYNIGILSAISNYIAFSNTNNFVVASEEQIKEIYNIDKLLFPFVGKFRLQKGLKKTNNYFVPKMTEFFEFLLNLYNSPYKIQENIFTKIYDFYKIAKENNDITKIEVIKKMCDCMRFQMVRIYDMGTNDLIFNDPNDYCRFKISLETSKIHNNAITELGIEDKVKKQLHFLFEKEKQKVKIK